MSILIPRPNADFLDISERHAFVPVPELNEFLEESLLNEHSPLFNEDHLHLTQADIGFLWTSKANKRQMKVVAGEAEMPNFKGGAWQKARQEQQLEDWFGYLPDFVITLSAGFASQCSDVELLALLEHELYHCGQRTDEFGMPKFRQSDGMPVFGMRGHDVEEFIGVVRRYGIAATGQDRVDFVEAAMQEPTIGEVKVGKLCGTCAV